jgi:8-oxo-dGTP pyrophosphatase MutT (NUDIX family)
MNGLIRVGYRIGAALRRVYGFVLQPTVVGSMVLVRFGDELVVLRTSYSRLLSVPGGMVQRGESPRLAAARELEEEVGIRVAPEQLRALGRLICHHSFIEDHVHFYELRLQAAPTLRVDLREVVWAELRSEPSLRKHRLWPPLEALLQGARLTPTDERGWLAPTDERL